MPAKHSVCGYLDHQTAYIFIFCEKVLQRCTKQISKHISIRAINIFENYMGPMHHLPLAVFLMSQCNYSELKRISTLLEVLDYYMSFSFHVKSIICKNLSIFAAGSGTCGKSVWVFKRDWSVRALKFVIDICQMSFQGLCSDPEWLLCLRKLYMAWGQVMLRSYYWQLEEHTGNKRHCVDTIPHIFFKASMKIML